LAQPTWRAPPLPPARGRTAAVGKGAKARIRKPDLAVDRIVVLRTAFAAIVLAFLYLVVWIGIQAFGGGGARQAKKIDRVIIDATNASPAPVARPDAAKAGAAPP
jgi:hypothetical protein